MSDKPEVPIVDAYRLPSGLYSFHCRFCGRPHVHGGHEGYRAAHCTSPRSVYNRTGYSLRLVGHIERLQDLPKEAA